MTIRRTEVGGFNTLGRNQNGLLEIVSSGTGSGMLRIYGHFVPVPAVVIGLCEILLTAANRSSPSARRSRLLGGTTR
ncbi:MAG: hypothetical protein ACRED7_07770 [Stellaceae bacterium]